MIHTQPLPLATDHPVFAGHFPGQPIVPGALLLDLAIAAIEAQLARRISHIAQAKFTRPARPGEPISLSFEQTGDTVALSLSSDGHGLASARLGLVPA